MTEYELFTALRPFYPAAEYALLPQVANGTGFGATRHCDAIAMSLWPSRGLGIHGFEIKSYRGDWVRELENPAKAESIAQYTNFWWIVSAGPFVKEDELPDNWGLKVWDRETGVLKIEKKPKFRDAVPLNTMMIGAILRKSQEVITPQAVIAKARQEGRDIGFKDGAADGKHAIDDLATLRARLAVIEKKTGVKVDCWEPAENIGDAMKSILDGSQSLHTEQLRRIAACIAIEFGIDEAITKEAQELIARTAKRKVRR